MALDREIQHLGCLCLAGALLLCYHVAKGRKAGVQERREDKLIYFIRNARLYSIPNMATFIQS